MSRLITSALQQLLIQIGTLRHVPVLGGKRNASDVSGNAGYLLL